MNKIVAKFGGSSLADAGQIRKVAEILRSDARRKVVVVSAPGKRNGSDTKVTDLLYTCCRLAKEQGDWQPVLQKIGDRFRAITEELVPDFPLDEELEIIRKHLEKAPDTDYMASRGEYLNGRIVAAYLGWTFIDAADVICFSENGTLEEEKTNERLSEALCKAEYAVLPGFYGALPNTRVKTFSRGGSDVSGALAARAAEAMVYENWTDVSGILFTNPQIVRDPRRIEYITYRELRELSYMGASVLHEDAVFPAKKAGIPIHVRNTNRPEEEGTFIVSSLPEDYRMRTVTGVAGKKGFCSILIEKSMMNGEIGFGARLLRILADCSVSFEHCPTGIDTMSVIVHQDEFLPNREEILRRIREELQPDNVTVEADLAMIAVVGNGMIASRGCAARIFRTVADAGINIRMIDQGSSEINIIIGVDEADFEEAIRCIYREFR